MCPQDPRGNFGFGGHSVSQHKKETPKSTTNTQKHTTIGRTLKKYPKTQIGQNRPQVGAMKKGFEETDQREKLRKHSRSNMLSETSKKKCLGMDRKPSTMDQ